MNQLPVSLQTGSVNKSTHLVHEGGLVYSPPSYLSAESLAVGLKAWSVLLAERRGIGGGECFYLRDSFGVWTRKKTQQTKGDSTQQRRDTTTET